MTLTRRQVLQTAAAASAASALTVGPWTVARAAKAEFSYKYANNLPATHPMNIRALINGAVSACLAILAIITIILFVENWVPELRGLRDNRTLLLLCTLILGIGISISVISTYRSIRKYLKMTLDDLY